VAGSAFISYSHADRAYVRRLAAHLADAGVTWFDDRIEYGALFDEVIEAEIDACAAFVVVMTPNAEKSSSYVSLEIAHARKRGKPILPLLLAGDGFFLLGNVNHEDVTGGRMPSGKFVDQLRTLVDAPPESPAPARRPAWSSPRRLIPLAALLTVTVVVVWLTVWVLGDGTAARPSPSPTPSTGTRATPLVVDAADLRVLRGHEGEVRSVAFGNGNGVLVSTGEDRTVKLWDVTRQEVTARWKLPGEGYRVAFGREGRLVAAGHAQGVAVYDVEKPEAPPVAELPQDAARALAFSSDGRTVATGDDHGTVRLWDLDTRRQVPLTGHPGRVSSVAFSPDGSTLVSADDQGYVIRWNTATRLRIGAETEADAYLNAVAWSPDGSLFATAGDHTRVWNGATGKLVRAIPRTVQMATVTFTPSGLLVTGDRTGAVLFWDPRTGNLVATDYAEHDEPVLTVAIAPKNRALATASAAGKIHVRRLMTGP
ncbi:TIR domain-containing protein, partial [Nonomuraea sp. RK-328]|nr:TIR domain-containing protein [Nonomuraea sp. RK-328]